MFGITCLRPTPGRAKYTRPFVCYFTSIFRSPTYTPKIQRGWDRDYGIPHVNDQHHRWAPYPAALASVMYLNDSDLWLISSMDRLFTSHIIVNNDGEYFFPIQYSVSIHSMCLFSWLITGRYTPIYRGSLQSWRLPHPSIDMTLLQWEVCVQNRTYARQSLVGPMSK